MQQAEINIDQVVDYRAEYSATVKHPKISGDNLTGLCPFHEDRNNSFSADLKTGKWHCFSEDIGGNFIDYWAKLYNVDTKEAYRQILEKYNIKPLTPEEKKQQEIDRTSYSVSQYAFEKHLPEDFLKEQGLTTERDSKGATYMKIPYYEESGALGVYRKRYAQKEFRWQYHSSGKIILYGLWKIAEIRSTGYVVLCEGESDSQSLWFMGIPALGCPGASMFKGKDVEPLKGLKVYVHQEPDKGGETFLRKVLEAMKDKEFEGEVYKFSCSGIEGTKDPSDLYKKYGKDDARNKIFGLLKSAKKLDLNSPDILPPAIGDAPVNLRQPLGYNFSDDGIFRINQDSGVQKLICRTPILLKRRIKSIETGEEKIELAYKRDGEWNEAILPRSTVFTNRGITILSDLGCTVTSENAKDLVRFLQALESENIDIIEKASATGSFGWQQGGKFIPGNNEGIVLDIDPTQKPMADAFSAEGSRNEWVEMMRPNRERDNFRFILAASFAAPLLRIIRQRIFFVYNWGDSKGGKTAGLKAALSAWGNPAKIMMNFNATQVGLERTASFFCDLPLGIDERQLAGRNQESLEKTVYMIASGQGKVRGTKSGGLQPTREWRTIAIATGEEPISKSNTQNGVNTRIIEIIGGPFDNEKDAERMHEMTAQNYGYAGPEFIKRVIAEKEDDIREKYKEMVGFFRENTTDSGAHIAGVAAVCLADAMIDSWFFKDDVPEPDEMGITEESWKRARTLGKRIIDKMQEEEPMDVNESAVQFVTDWVLENKSQFGEKAIGTCYGDITEEGNIVYILPSALTAALEKGGFSARKTLGYMAREGYIGTSKRTDKKSRNNTIMRRFLGRTCRMVEFKISMTTGKTEDAFEEHEDDGFVPIDGQEALPFQ